jgi:hypothetical protein
MTPPLSLPPQGQEEVEKGQKRQKEGQKEQEKEAQR